MKIAVVIAILLPFAAGAQESGKALIDLGIQALAANNPDQAFDYFDQARNRDSSRLDTADLWMGVVPPGVYRPGGPVTAPSVISKVDPGYNEQARLVRLSGTVTLVAEMDPDGVPLNITVTGKAGLGMDEKAIEAVQQWRFNPGMKDGQPVPVLATIEVNFRLL